MFGTKSTLLTDAGKFFFIPPDLRTKQNWGEVCDERAMLI